MLMARRNRSLHGNTPDRSPLALLVIDMVNDLEFEGGSRLLPRAVAAARRIAALKRRARERRVPVIYVNDNFGRWRSDFREAVEHCLHDGVRGQPLAELLRPGKDDYFVLKPKHSGFYATTLGTLLDHLGAERLILTGISGDTCVLATAMDAYLRDFELHVPADCMASISPAHDRAALAYMKRALHADIRGSTRLDLRRLTKRAPGSR
jgi:nicotinamidase-related amidase